MRAVANGRVLYRLIQKLRVMGERRMQESSHLVKDERHAPDFRSCGGFGEAEQSLNRSRRSGVARSLAILRFGLCVLLLAPLASGARAQKHPEDLTTVSIESLMQMEVTSVSKKQEQFSQTAAALYVITQEDIRRSGATSIPELLRMVPGLDVAHIDANTWAISARGLNDRFTSKMLVLTDGRTVYSPLFSRVYWDVQDTLLEDIERIEVIRGPGATLWGANAVNGVINVITKHAKDTQGGLVNAGAGNQERGFGAFRYGGSLSHRGYYRFFAKYFDRDAFAEASGQPAADSWSILRGGFRTDWTLSARDSLTVQGDLQRQCERDRCKWDFPVSTDDSIFQRPHPLGGREFAVSLETRLLAPIGNNSAALLRPGRSQGLSDRCTHAHH